MGGWCDRGQGQVTVTLTREGVQRVVGVTGDGGQVTVMVTSDGDTHQGGCTAGGWCDRGQGQVTVTVTLTGHSVQQVGQGTRDR